MRKEMASSMLRYGWYAIRNVKLNLHSEAPIPIGMPQVGDQPGYYFLASLPLRLMPDAGIILQYFAARSVSLLLFLLILVVIWYALGEILPRDHPLRWMVPVFAALLPAFVDTMTAVNNDVGAVLAASLAIWACLRLIRKGLSFGRIVFLAWSLAACYLSKGTALFAFGLAPIALVLALLRGKFPLMGWGVVVLGLAALCVLTFSWGSPKDWVGSAAGAYPARIGMQAAPLGQQVFQFDDAGVGTTSQLAQIIPPDQVESLSGRSATLGAWVWADQATQAGPFYIAFLHANGSVVASPPLLIDVTTTPLFHSITFDVPGDARAATVYILQTGHGRLHNNVFFDGLVLAPGKFGAAPPKFADAGGMQGEWDGSPFQNVLRNASAEQGSFQIRKSVLDRTASLWASAGFNPALAMTTIQDWNGSGWYYRAAASTLLRTFWTSLAGDKAVLPDPYSAFLLLALTLAGVLGVLLLLWERRRNLSWDVVGFLGIALLVPWAITGVRGNVHISPGDMFYPWARYAYPAILPTALCLCAGWLHWLWIASARMKFNAAARDAIFLSLMAGICTFAIMNAVRLFHPAWWFGWGFVLGLWAMEIAIVSLVRTRQMQPGPGRPSSGNDPGA